MRIIARVAVEKQRQRALIRYRARCWPGHGQCGQIGDPTSAFLLEFLDCKASACENCERFRSNLFLSDFAASMGSRGAHTYTQKQPVCGVVWCGRNGWTRRASQPPCQEGVHISGNVDYQGHTVIPGISIRLMYIML